MKQRASRAQQLDADFEDFLLVAAEQIQKAADWGEFETVVRVDEDLLDEADARMADAFLDAGYNITHLEDCQIRISWW